MTILYILLLVIGYINAIVVPLIFSIAFVVFLWGIFQYFIAGGADTEKREQGKNLALWGIIGFAIMISVWGLVNILVHTFGFDSGVRPRLPTFGSDSGYGAGLGGFGSQSGDNGGGIFPSGNGGLGGVGGDNGQGTFPSGGNSNPGGDTLPGDSNPAGGGGGNPADPCDQAGNCNI